MAAGNRKSSNKRKTQTKKERMAEMEKAQAFRVEVTLWIVVAAALLLFISNLGFGGAVGKTVSGFLFGMFGLMAYVLPVLLLVGSFFAVSNRGNKLAAVKLIAAIVFLVFLCTFMGLAMNGNDQVHPLDAYTYCAERHTGGGIIGGCLAYYMCQAFGLIGSFIIDIIVLIVCMVLITERSALRGMQKGGKKVYESAKESNEKYREYREYRAQERKERRMDHKVSGVSIDTRIEEKGKKNKKRKSDEMGELSAPAFDMMPDTTVSPMPKKISSPAPVAVLEEPAAEIQPEISGDFMPDTFPPEPSQVAPVPEHIAGLAPAKDVLKPAEKTQKKKKRKLAQNVEKQQSLTKKAKKGRKDQKERNEAAGCTRQERAVLESFFADVKAEVDWKRIEVRKGFAYYLPEGVEGKKNLVFVRNGLYLGEIRKDRFEPSQAFAMVLQKKDFASSIDFPAMDERVIRYLKGETVDVSDLECGKEKGWQLVCVDGYPLGWGKLVNGTLKNKYLSGWRMKVNG